MQKSDDFCTKIARFSRVFRAFSAFYSCLSDRTAPGAFSSVAVRLLSPALLPLGVRSVRRPVSECMANKLEYPTRSRAGRPGCYPQRPGSRSTTQRTTCRPGAVRLNDQSRPTTQREARAVSPILSGGIVRLLGDRRNLGRFRAIAGQWRATFSEGWPPGLLASTTKAGRRCSGRPAQSLRDFRVWGLFGFWEIGGIWGGSVRLRDNCGRHSSRAGCPSCWPQQVQGRGLRTAVVFPACFYMPNLAPLCMVWGGVISNEDITAKTRHRGNRNDPENLRPWGLNCPPPYRMQTATRAGRLSFVCRAGVCRHGYGTATALRIYFSTAERLVSRRAVCML